MLRYSIIYILFFLIVVSPSSGPLTASFNQSKKQLTKIYAAQETKKTFYCGCAFEDKKILNRECSFQTNKYKNRQTKLEWEHIMPAYKIGGHLQCWKKGHEQCITKKGKTYKGRRCCRKVDATFKEAEADPFNLVPAIGALNAIRSNFAMGEIPLEKRDYGQCDIEIDSKIQRVEPAKFLRGDIARIYLYMAIKYQIPLNDNEKKLFKDWDIQDPIDDTEQWRINIVREITQK